MGRNAGFSMKNGKPEQKSNIKWIEYDIAWTKMAKSNCKKCYGRGIEGFEPQTEEQKDRNEPKSLLLCNCVGDVWSKMTDEERLMFATRKDNADEIVSQAKETIKNMVDEMTATTATA